MKRALAVLVLSTLSAAALPALAQNTATINQQGSLGVATISQGAAPASLALEASIFQGPGVGSRAAVDQNGMDAQVSIRQFGDRQTATVLQAPVDGGHVTVSQGGGSGNTTSIEQRAHSATANVLQHGSSNLASVIQNGFSVRADVTQKGTGNSVTVAQGFDVMDQRVSVEQRGANNRGEVGLGGPDGNSAALVQAGTDNLATIHGVGLLASIEQDGANLVGDISLNGEGSKATIQQRGTANRAYILSVGDDNLATIRQGGQNNLARIDQNGAGLVATIVQNTTSPGYGNVATIIQR
jgi:hypothetical protein